MVICSGHEVVRDALQQYGATHGINQTQNMVSKRRGMHAFRVRRGVLITMFYYALLLRGTIVNRTKYC